ncbi:MAG: hypothetical protein EXR52_05940 [Dehalococcoidia bacterium]|nr:hypothetical protein [Dehalococcoidia bacterium]
MNWVEAFEFDTGADGASGQPKAGGSLKVRITSDIDNWDITIVGKNIANRYSPSVTNRLLGDKAAKDIGYGDVVLTPELAEKWEVSPDAKTPTRSIQCGWIGSESGSVFRSDRWQETTSLFPATPT